MRPNWNISLFHYRNQGADYGRILVALQVPPAMPRPSRNSSPSWATPMWRKPGTRSTACSCRPGLIRAQADSASGRQAQALGRPAFGRPQHRLAGPELAQQQAVGQGRADPVGLGRLAVGGDQRSAPAGGIAHHAEQLVTARFAGFRRGCDLRSRPAAEATQDGLRVGLSLCAAGAGTAASSASPHRRVPQ